MFIMATPDCTANLSCLLSYCARIPPLNELDAVRPDNSTMSITTDAIMTVGNANPARKLLPMFRSITIMSMVSPRPSFYISENALKTDLVYNV